MVAVVKKAARVGRVQRNPKHSFNLRFLPFEIQPFLIMPVIPGETLKNLSMQARTVTDPIKNGLIGWWSEYYLFYIKLRDLDDREVFTAMMLDPDEDLAAYAEPASPKFNHFGGSINWAKLCLNRVRDTYFRHEDDDGTYQTAAGLPLGAINANSYIQSALLSDAYTLADVEVDGNADNEIMASEIDTAMRMYQFQRANNLTEMTYEDWLATYGIRQPRAETNRPELLRYLRDWQYPSNTVDPTSGAPTSAVSWATRERADKDRFFSEPGFIFGVTLARPKVYMRNLSGSAVDQMRTALTWLPALMRDDPWTSMVKLGQDQGPLQGVVSDADGYWFDIKDLLVYGDDFVNFDRAATDANMVTLPSANLTNKEFPTEADCRALFVGTTADKQFVRTDGIVDAVILGTQTDTTPAASLRA